MVFFILQARCRSPGSPNSTFTNIARCPRASSFHHLSPFHIERSSCSQDLFSIALRNCGMRIFNYRPDHDRIPLSTLRTIFEIIAYSACARAVYGGRGTPEVSRARRSLECISSYKIRQTLNA